MYNQKKAKPKIKKSFTKQLVCTSLNGELIMFMGDYGCAMFGRVYKISRGDKCDIVELRCGFKAKTRQVIVVDNHARRQILTLKRGQWCIIVGDAKIYNVEVTLKNGEKRKAPKWHFFAYMIQGFYVPKAFDVKKREEDIANGIEQDYIDPLNEDDEKNIDNIINGLFEVDKPEFGTDLIEYEGEK